MNTTEQVVEKLISLGLPPHSLNDDEETEGNERTEYLFEYHRTHFLLMSNGGDENFVRMAIPQVFDVTPENRTMLLEIIMRLGYQLKYVKAAIAGESVWIYFEHFLKDDVEISEDSVEFIIRTLSAAHAWLMNAIENYDPEELDN